MLMLMLMTFNRMTLCVDADEPFMAEKRVAGTAEGPSGYKSLCVYLYDLYDHYNDYDDNRDVCEIPVSGRHKIVENWVYC